MILITFLSMAWSFYNRFGGAVTVGIFILMVILVIYVAYYISMNTDEEYNEINKEKEDKKKNNQNKTHSDEKSWSDGKNIDEEFVQGSDQSLDYGNSPTMHYVPKDSDIIKVVTRADFVDRYVGWTSPKTVKLLEENLGKVLFVDEAYSLINGPHDEFGMEALTALNLFLSQRPKEIIVIFAGYKDLLESGPYAVQTWVKTKIHVAI